MGKIFSEILSMTVDSAWLIIAVIIVRALLQKSPMYFRKILWGLVGIRLLIPFSFESAFSLIPEKVPQTADQVVGQVVAANVEKGFSFADAVPFLWIAVGITFLVYGIISYIRLRLKIIDGILIKSNVYQSEKIQSPFVCGFVKPKIYVPYGLDDTTRKCVLEHEQTHIKYADHIIKAIGFVVLCVHWFNPLVWVSYFLLCKDIELACDESVIKKYDADECKEYAKALLDLGVNKVKLSACPIAFGEVSIKKRIKSVISYKKASKILVAASLCVCIGVSLCFMTEPEVPLKEKAEEVEVSEETTEPATERVKEPTTDPTTEATTEPSTEPVTEPVTEAVAEIYEVEETPTIDYEELNSIIESQKDRLREESIRRNEILMSEANKNNQSNLGSNSSVIGTKPSNTVTLPSFNWDPAVTVQGGHNYQHTRPYNPNNPNDQFYMW